MRQKTSPIIQGNRVTFQHAAPTARMVNVLGTFNHWSLPDGAMIRRDDGVWETTIDVPLEGSYDYKFIVDGEWVLDSRNPDYGKDAKDRYNSRFLITTSASAVDHLRSLSANLASHPPGSGRLERTEALLHADRLLQLPTAPHSRILKDHLAERFQLLSEKMSQKDLSFIGSAYCHGNVIQCDGKTFAVDLVTTRSVWGMYWIIPPAVVEGLADGIDLLCVSHLHPDHFDPLIIRLLAARKTPVLVPEEAEDRFPEGVIPMAPDSEYRFDGWTVVFHKGVHVYDERRMLILRYFEFISPSGRRFIHTADHDYTTGIARRGPVDVLIAKTNGIHPNVEGGIALQNALAHLRPRRCVMGHLNELGHPVGGGREPFRTAIDYMRRIPHVQSDCLHWGETWDL